MSATNARLVALLLLAPLLAAGIAVRSPAEPALAQNTVDVDNDNKVITITINANLIGNDLQVPLLEADFEEYWGKEGGYTYRCYKVVFKLDLVAASSPQRGRHTVFIVPTKFGDPFIATVSSPRDYRPAEESATGRWSKWDGSTTQAHEWGHVLGLPDEYNELDTNGNGERDYGEGSVPDPSRAPEYSWTDDSPMNGIIDAGEVSLKPGEQPSLMAELGRSQVLQRHIDSIIDKHAPSLTECQGTLSGTITETPLKDDYRELTRSADFEGWFDIDDDGNVTGEITLTYDAVLTVEDLPGADVGIAAFDPEVGGRVTDPNPTRSYPLTGSLEGDGLTLEIATPEEERERDPIEFTIIADPGVSAGLGGGDAFTAPGGNVQIIKIDMTPFTPFGGFPATVEDNAVHFLEEGDGYQIKWDAELANVAQR